MTVNQAASDRPSRGLLSSVIVAVLAATELGANCVDGVTPDCSDAAICAPSEGYSNPTDASSAEPEAGLADAGRVDADGG